MNPYSPALNSSVTTQADHKFFEIPITNNSKPFEPFVFDILNNGDQAKSLHKLPLEQKREILQEYNQIIDDLSCEDDLIIKIGILKNKILKIYQDEK
ncbi:hypothetical protein BN1013_02032 [Candidatus Rubidus massiliensis]|nr:hypothetical protein BN1013_02032 [Candidatus Rubidus massiliensis]